MSQPHPATAVLRDEHQAILSVLSALEKLLDHADRGGDCDFAALEDCVTFFRLFADACHHGKEEDLLFPELEARGIPRDGGPIGVMLHEHQQGRALVRRMREHLPAAREGGTPARSAVFQAGREFIDLLRGHIGKEDNVLFMMADQVLDRPACQELCNRYERVCDRQFEGHTKQQLQALAARIATAVRSRDPRD